MRKCYILDTNVLIENPKAVEILRNGEENEIFLPYSVILELDRLKRRPHLTHIVSNISDNLLDDKVTIIKNDRTKYSSAGANDDSILSDIRFAFSKKAEYFKDFDPIVVTNDKLFRLRLQCENIQSQEFLMSMPFETESEKYTGFVNNIDDLYSNCFYWDKNVGKLFYSRTNDYLNHENQPWKIIPRNYYQNAALELMLDPEIDIVSIQSVAGLGKTYLSLATALSLMLEKKLYKKIFIFKPIVYIAEKMGFLPGSYDEKLAPFVRNIRDLIIKLHSNRPANKLFLDEKSKSLELNPDKIEILDLNVIRGMNIEDAVVIVDEAQNLTRYQTRTLLTRMGNNVKCLMLGDINQVDNPLLNSSNNGLNWVVKKFIHNSNYAHITLKGKYSRGPITDLVLKTDL